MNKKLICAFVFSSLFAISAVGCAPRKAADNPERKAIRAPKQPPPPTPVVREPIDSELRGRARLQLNDALESNDAVLRANAIEGLQVSIGAEAAEAILKGLGDQQPIVRFASAMAAGELRLRGARDSLVKLAEDADKSVRVAAIYALHRIGDTRRSHDLEKLSMDPARGVRANVALVLGRLGEKSALNILRTMNHDREPVVRLQVAEAMWRLGDEQGLEDLVAASMSSAPDDQIIATLALAGPKDTRVSGHVHGKLVSDYPEVSLAAARAMGMLQSDAGYTVALNGTKSTDLRQKVLSALALGAIGRSDAQSTLSRMLADANANVRLAAATAILQLKPPGEAS